jgi:UTP--glucose-1-phosphate uridylyltransferase
MLPDDLIDNDPSATEQLIRVSKTYGKGCVGLIRVPDSQVQNYGIVSGKVIEDGVFDLTSLIEKPKREDAPSNLSIIGRYILPPSIFEYIESVEPGVGGEIQLTDALRMLLEREGFLGVELKGKRFDTGSVIGLLKANIAYAMKQPDIREEILEFFAEITK